jgi:hypothetical protein
MKINVPSDFKPWIQFDKNLYVIPCLPFRLVFAQLVWMAFEQSEFDYIAVEMPPSFKNGRYIDIALKLNPAIGVIYQEVEDFIFWFTPNDALLMAVRCATKFQTNIQYVDWDYRKDLTRKPMRVNFDDYLVFSKGLEWYYEAIKNEIVHPQQRRRIAEIVSNIINIKRNLNSADTGKILLVCNASSWEPIKEALSGDLSFPPDEAPSSEKKLEIGLIKPTYMWKQGFLDDFPSISYQFERGFSEGQLSPWEFDKKGSLNDLIHQIFKSDYVKRDQNVSLENISTLKRFCDIVCLINRRLVPDFNILQKSAQTCMSRRFTEVLTSFLLDYPEPEYQPDLEEKRNLKRQMDEIINELKNNTTMKHYYKELNYLLRIFEFYPDFDDNTKKGDSEIKKIEGFLSNATKYLNDLPKEPSLEILKWLFNEDLGTEDDWPDGSPPPPPFPTTDKQLWAAASELRLLLNLSAEAKQLIKVTQRYSISEKFSGSFYSGIDVKGTIRARARGDKNSFFVKRENPKLRYQVDYICPVVFIFDYDAEKTKWSRVRFNQTIHTLYWYSSEKYDEETQILQEFVVALVELYSDFINVGWGITFPEDFPDKRKLLDENFAMEWEIISSIIYDENKFNYVDHALAWAIRFAGNHLILIADPNMAIIPEIQDFAIEKGVRIIRIPIGRLPRKKIDRLRLHHFSTDTGFDSKIIPVEL